MASALASQVSRCHDLGMDTAPRQLREPRVVSLIASATEIVHALGAGRAQVARSHECDWPPAVLDLPALTRPKFKVEGSSREIDKAVRALVERGLAVYEVDAEALKALAPDVILTQDQCEVCAVSLADVERAVCSWTGSAPQIVSLRPHSMADVYTDIRRVASALGRIAHGEALVGSMQQRIAALAARVAGRPTPRLAFIEWIDPPMSGGHWMPELIEAAGGISLFGESGANSPWITWEQVAAADPDAILVAPCGYDIGVTEREMRALAGNAVFNGLRAVRAARVFLADGNAYFNRPGPRLIESTEILAEILHPGVCDFAHRGRAFVPYAGGAAPLRETAAS
jgi:iron complex transport system substrate-binding protein